MCYWFGRPDRPRETQQFWDAMGDLQARIEALGSHTRRHQGLAGPRPGADDVTRHEVALLVDDASPASHVQKQCRGSFLDFVNLHQRLCMSPA